VVGYVISILLLIAFSAGVLALLILVLAFSWPQALLCLAVVLGGGYLLASREPPARDLDMNESVWYDDETDKP
jgi:hypothetical protein